MPHRDPGGPARRGAHHRAGAAGAAGTADPTSTLSTSARRNARASRSVSRSGPPTRIRRSTDRSRGKRSTRSAPGSAITPARTRTVSNSSTTCGGSPKRAANSSSWRRERDPSRRSRIATCPGDSPRSTSASEPMPNWTSSAARRSGGRRGCSRGWVARTRGSRRAWACGITANLPQRRPLLLTSSTGSRPGCQRQGG